MASDDEGRSGEELTIVKGVTIDPYEVPGVDVGVFIGPISGSPLPGYLFVVQPNTATDIVRVRAARKRMPPNSRLLFVCKTLRIRPPCW
jgi:hypothetical protein